MRLGNSFPKTNGPVTFREVIYNGQNSYDVNTGYFKCEIPGVYEFEFYAMISKIDASLDLMHNDRLILHSYTTRQNGYITASGSVFVRLLKGDIVWLLAGHGSNGLTKESIFSGHLLFTE